MNAKELQEQYLESRRGVKKPNTPVVGDFLPKGYRDHVFKQFERISKHLGHEAGLAYVKDALKDYPLELEAELKRIDI